MAIVVTTRPATLDDVLELAPVLRKTDKDEIYAAFGLEPAPALIRSLNLSTHAWAHELDGKLVAISGVGPLSLLTGNGSPWMVGSDAVDKHPILLLKNSKPVVDRMIEAYPVLTNWVDARNKSTIRWLKWLGFHVEQAKPWGYLQLPFHKFELLRK